MTQIRLALMLYFFMVAHKAAYQAPLKAKCYYNSTQKTPVILSKVQVAIYSQTHAFTFDLPKLEWPDYAVQALCGKLWRKWAHMQLIREHLAIVISDCWAIVDWSWPKEWNSLSCMLRWLPLKFSYIYKTGKKSHTQAGNNLLNLPSESSHARKSHLYVMKT